MRSGTFIAVGSLVVLVLLGVLLTRLGQRPSQPIDKPELVVFCAAGVKPPVVELARQFEQEYGVSVRFHFGGSGTLLSNLLIARQGDLYLAGDAGYVEKALEKGVVEEILPLAYMKPVVVVPRGNPKGINSVEDLLGEGMRIALGNPGAAAIGKQTAALLKASGHWERLKARVEADGVFKPTVPEIANDIKLGAVDAGIVWDATARQYPELEIVPLAELAAGRKEISIGVLVSSEDPTLSLRFARYLNSTVGNEIFRKHHYDPVPGDAWAWQPEITFFCGSVNRRAVVDVVAAFEKREGVTVNTLYNGCGILTAQMRTIRQDEDGAGFPDTYMACDRYYLDNVKDWFQEDLDVSEADIVIAVPKGNPKRIRGLRDLVEPDMRIAVGQPDQCTIGALTRMLLEKEGLYEQIMQRVVTQTSSSAMLVPCVTTQSVDAALAYVTDTLAEAERVDTVRIDSPYAKAVQPFSIARSSAHKYLGRRLLKAVAGARDKFEGAGFRYLLDDEGAPR